MRIAFIVGRFPALSETFILNQITGLIDRGHEVDIFPGRPTNEVMTHQDVTTYRLLERTYYPLGKRPYAPDARSSLLLLGDCLKHPGILMASLNAGRYGKQAVELTLLKSAIPFLRKPPYDIIHAHFGPNGLKAALLRDIGAIRGRLLTTFHGYDVTSFPTQRGRDIYIPLFEQGERYTANTNFTASQLKALGCPPDKIVRLPMGVDCSRFTFQERRLLPEQNVNILTVGRLFEGKGVEYSLRAIARVAAIHPRVRYWIVGDGPLRAHLEALVRVLGISQRVTFFGPVTQERMRELYSRAHVFVLGSITTTDGWQEAQGMVLVEAQAVGLPVLATRVGGIPEVVQDGSSGFLVAQKDADALAERLLYLLGHPELLLQMGKAGRAFVTRNFDIGTLNDRLVEIYREMIGPSKPLDNKTGA